MARDCRLWRGGAHHRNRLRAISVGRDLAGCVVWLIRPCEKKIVLNASVGLLSETIVVLPIALGYWVYVASVGKTMAWTLPPSMFIELLLSGVVTALPLFCTSSRPHGVFHTRIRTIHRADNHAFTERICVQGIGVVYPSRWFCTHLDSACYIRCGISSWHKSQEGKCTP